MIKKTNKPVNAYIARIEENRPDMEKYCLMVADANGEININNKNYRIVGDTYFFIDKECCKTAWVMFVLSRKAILSRFIMQWIEIIKKQPILY